MGAYHTEDDVILIIPEEKIAFTGDLLFVKMHPYMGESNPEEWQNKLIELRHLGIERFVPGHGTLAGHDEIEELVIYFQTIMELSIELAKSGISSDEINEVEIPENFRKWDFPDFFYYSLSHLVKNQSVRSNDNEIK